MYINFINILVVDIDFLIFVGAYLNFIHIFDMVIFSDILYV